MYHVIDTGLTAILLYLISYFFYRIGYYSLQFHRKLWNTLLAIAFLTTIVAGLFMALQISYKWNVLFIKSVLKWHVEFGIGMAFTGLFHFTWHLSYYWKGTQRSDKIVAGNIELPKSPNIRLNLFIIGFVSTSVQLLLIREIMNISGGYELIAGTFLGSWLIGSAIGSAIAGNSQLNDIRKVNIVFSVSPLISLFFLVFFSRIFLNSGETPSFLVSMIYTFLVLLPFCLVSGFTFVKLIEFAKSGKNFSPGKSFSIETTGGIASGILISILTAGLLNNYKLLIIIITLTVGYVLITYNIRNPRKTKIYKILIAFLAIAVIVSDPDVLFRQILHPGIKVTESKDTPYGNITKGIYRNEESIFYNQRLLSFKNDIIQSEEDIHYAMLQCEKPEKIILVSGALQPRLHELLKYSVKEITYIERDPSLAKSETSTITPYPVKFNIENTDAFNYIRNNRESADVIILLIPPPSTLLLNKYYTTEFFTQIKKRLNSDGVFMCSPGPGDNYFNKESLNLYSSVFNSLSAIFKYVKPVVGNKLYFIASDKEMTLSYCSLAEKRNIQNIYVGPDFLADDLITKKSEEVISQMDSGIKQNRLTFPMATFHFLSYSFSKDRGEKIPSIILMIIIFALPVSLIKRENLVMYFSASALAGFEIIMLLTLQLIVGNMYQLTGLIIAGLMTGLAIGTGTNKFYLTSFPLKMKIILLLLFYCFIGLVYNYFLEARNEFVSIVLILLSVFIPAFYTGQIFRELTLTHEGNSSSIYSADLAGSAFGFILISGIIVPAFGIKVSIFLLSALVFTGFLFGTIRNK